MHKVVIDTNVVVSAMLTPSGNAARIIDLINDEQLQICFNNEILDEYIEVLSRPHFGFSISDRDGLIEGFRESGLMVDSE
jgi:putative PIN family toxin of toxin-antitoxin system